MKLLSRRDYSTLELKQKLMQRECSLTDISLIIAYCMENDWLNDQRFATALLNSSVAKGYGWLKVCYYAKQKGIDLAILEKAEKAEPHDWFELAKKLARKRFGDINGELPNVDCKQRAKWSRYLQQRGFSFDEIKYALSLK